MLRSVILFHYALQHNKNAFFRKKLHPISNASTVVETPRKPSSLFLLCFIGISHPRLVSPFPRRRPLIRLDACRSPPLLASSPPSSYCIKPRRATFLLFLHRGPLRISHQSLPFAPWRLIRNVLA